VVKNHVATMFRDKNLNHARNELDRMQTQLLEEKRITQTYGIRQTYVSQQDFESSKLLLSIFSSAKPYDYKLRIEGSNMSIYSNELDFMHNICSKVQVQEFWQPNNNYKDKLDKDIILVDQPFDYEFKVTFNQNTIDPTFAKWVHRNTNKIKIGNKALQAATDGYAQGLYFYVRNEKLLQLISLMIGHNFQSVQRIVCKQDLDK
jgi:hypothetical protein